MKLRTILIVDDEDVNLKILNKILCPTYDVLQAKDGEETLAILKEKKSDISAIILDIIMPKMNGFQVLEIIQKDKFLNKIPVIVSTQQNDEQSEIKALSLGAQDFTSKPYNVEILLHRLENIIKLRETASIINVTEKDDLTGLYNKPYFIHNAAEIISSNPSKIYDLICVYIENFDSLKDVFGDEFSTRLLKTFAVELKQNLEKNAICSHFAKSEFYILMPHKNVYKDCAIDKWLPEEKRQFEDVKLKINFGIYKFTNNVDVSDMCRKAKLACETIIGNFNKWFVYYDNSILDKLIAEQHILDSVEKSIKNGDFEVFYQPKYDITSNKIAGAEALVKWHNPTNGLMQPLEFIPLLEKNGLIAKLDYFVWEQTCIKLQQLIQENKTPLAISVNVSRAELYDLQLRDKLVSLLEKYNIPPKYLHLEITESVHAEDAIHMIPIIQDLNNAGFIIEMDDFGSGYSSLNMLYKMPVDILKFDVRFIQSAAINNKGIRVLRLILNLARTMGVPVIVEGVETKKQLLLLQTMGCEYVQGFYFAKPLSSNEFTDLLNHSQLIEMRKKIVFSDFDE